MTNSGLCAAGPDFEYPLPELEGCPPARPVAELSGPPDDIAFPAPAGADTEPGEVPFHCFVCAKLAVKPCETTKSCDHSTVVV